MENNVKKLPFVIVNQTLPKDYTTLTVLYIPKKYSAEELFDEIQKEYGDYIVERIELGIKLALNQEKLSNKIYDGK